MQDKAMPSRDRLSVINSQIHAAATSLKQQRADLILVERDPIDSKQWRELKHAAIRAATHARALLDDINKLEI